MPRRTTPQKFRRRLIAIAGQRCLGSRQRLGTGLGQFAPRHGRVVCGTKRHYFT